MMIQMNVSKNIFTVKKVGKNRKIERIVSLESIRNISVVEPINILDIFKKSIMIYLYLVFH